MIKDIRSILKNSVPDPGEMFYDGFSFEKNFKTMIIDDEADYASQDTKSREGGSAIHNELVELRTIIPKNCYVAYTATPQACIAADPRKLVGYPNDFLWHIDPHRDEEGNTTTYLGLEEFLKKYPKYLTPVIPNKVWPHYKKDSETAKKLGIYDDKGKN